MHNCRRMLMKHIWIVLLAVILISSNAAAQEFGEKLWETRSDCSINLQLAYTDSTTGKRVQLSGGKVAVYKVSDALVSNGNRYFNPKTSGQFQKLAKQNTRDGKAIAAIRDYDSKELTTRNASLAKILAANTSGIKGITGTIKKGSVTVGGLMSGLYLMVQTKKSPENASFAPFLFSLPDADGNYQVTASPKPSVTVSKKDKPDKPSGGNSGRLPQTGQLWWPVPVLLLAGLLLVIIGTVMRSHGRMQEAAEGS